MINETLPGISVIVPVYNEEESLSILVDKLIAVLRQLPNRFEILLVNDGSQDGSLALLRSLSQANRELKVVDFRRNYGTNGRHRPRYE